MVARPANTRPSGFAGTGAIGAQIQREEPDVPTEDQIREAIRVVEDPEIGISIMDLGLVYDTAIGDDGSVKVTMTLTTPFCPAGPLITNQVEAVVSSLPGVEKVEVDITFNPPWDPRTMASDEVKAMLGMW